MLSPHPRHRAAPAALQGDDLAPRAASGLGAIRLFFLESSTVPPRSIERREQDLSVRSGA